MDGLTEEEINAKLTSDPGDPLFAQFADDLRRRGEWHRALEISFRGLSSNPACHRGRLVLARLFYEKHLFPFAVRELEALHHALPENLSIQHLLERLSPGGSQESEELRGGASADGSSEEGEGSGVVAAEEEFDIDVLAESTSERDK